MILSQSEPSSSAAWRGAGTEDGVESPLLVARAVSGGPADSRARNRLDGVRCPQFKASKALMARGGERTMVRDERATKCKPVHRAERYPAVAGRICDERRAVSACRLPEMADHLRGARLCLSVSV